MMTPTPDPPRLVETNDAAGALLRASLPEYATGLPSAASTSSERRPGEAPKTARAWWPVALSGVACASALAFFFVAAPRPTGPGLQAPTVSARGPIIVPIENASPEAPAEGSTPARPEVRAKHRAMRSVALRAQPQPLEAGEEVALTDGSRVRLAWGGVASVSVPESDRTVVALSRGMVGLVVTKRRPGEHFEVHAGPYTFRVVGTSFTVDLREGEAALAVAEGTVAVNAGDHELGRITAGGVWSGEVGDHAPPAMAQPAQAELHPPAEPVTPFAAPAPPPSREIRRPDIVEPPKPAPPPRVPASTECLKQARAGATRRAAGCLEAVAASQGLEAEIALVELARLRRDALDDTKGALAALADYRTRFPQGALYDEALTASVDLLVRTGDGPGALAESDRLLRRVVSEQRRAELHLLRGNVLRVLENDCRRADAEYAAAGKAQRADRVVDDAAFWRAVCLATVGERDGATRAFTLYLDRPRPQHAAEAKTRLEGLRR